MSDTQTAPQMKTLEDVIARLEQVERAVHLNIGADGKAVPHPPEPLVPHILINIADRKVRTLADQNVPVAAGYVYQSQSLPRSQVTFGLHPKAPGAIFVEHPTLKEGETASAEELAALVAAAKPIA